MIVIHFSPESALVLHVHPTVLRTIERFCKFWTVLKSSEGSKLARAKTLQNEPQEGIPVRVGQNLHQLCFPSRFGAPGTRKREKE
jgi:hypothetical protein